jgi:hypothetical protein
MFYDATDTQNPTPGDGIHLKLAIATMTIAQIVATNEGTKDTSSLTTAGAVRPDTFFRRLWTPRSSDIASNSSVKSVKHDSFLSP